jgi:hemerythrin superfamily protein
MTVTPESTIDRMVREFMRAVLDHNRSPIFKTP